MDQIARKPSLSFWDLFISSLPKVPWHGFVCGLFLPLVLMQIGGMLQTPTFSALAAIGVCVLFFAIEWRRTKQPNAFALITFFMITTQYAAHALAARHPTWTAACSFVAIIDEGTLAVLFFLSLGTKKPLILMFLGKEVTESIPEQIQKSSYYLAAWKAVTFLWGALYAAQTAVLAFLLCHHVPGEKWIEFAFGWPIVMVFLVISVMLPRWYWITRMAAIEQENVQRRA